MTFTASSEFDPALVGLPWGDVTIQCRVDRFDPELFRSQPTPDLRVEPSPPPRQEVPSLRLPLVLLAAGEAPDRAGGDYPSRLPAIRWPVETFRIG